MSDDDVDARIRGEWKKSLGRSRAFPARTPSISIANDATSSLPLLPTALEITQPVPLEPYAEEEGLDWYPNQPRDILTLGDFFPIDEFIGSYAYGDGDNSEAYYDTPPPVITEEPGIVVPIPTNLSKAQVVFRNNQRLIAIARRTNTRQLFNPHRHTIDIWGGGQNAESARRSWAIFNEAVARAWEPLPRSMDSKRRRRSRYPFTGSILAPFDPDNAYLCNGWHDAADAITGTLASKTRETIPDFATKCIELFGDMLSVDEATSIHQRLFVLAHCTPDLDPHYSYDMLPTKQTFLITTIAKCPWLIVTVPHVLQNPACSFFNPEPTHSSLTIDALKQAHDVSVQNFLERTASTMNDALEQLRWFRGPVSIRIKLGLLGILSKAFNERFLDRLAFQSLISKGEKPKARFIDSVSLDQESFDNVRRIFGIRYQLFVGYPRTYYTFHCRHRVHERGIVIKVSYDAKGYSRFDEALNVEHSIRQHGVFSLHLGPYAYDWQLCIGASQRIGGALKADAEELVRRTFYDAFEVIFHNTPSMFIVSIQENIAWHYAMPKENWIAELRQERHWYQSSDTFQLWASQAAFDEFGVGREYFARFEDVPAGYFSECYSSKWAGLLGKHDDLPLGEQVSYKIEDIASIPASEELLSSVTSLMETASPTVQLSL